MQKKTPQGNIDPVPTPEQELERYGVWVKSEPQDVLDEHAIDRELIVELPAGEPETEPSPQEAEVSFDVLEDLPPLEDSFEPEPELSLPDEAPSAAGTDDSSFDIHEFDIEELDTDQEPEALANHIIEDSIIDIDLDDLESSPDEAAPSELTASDSLEAEDVSSAESESFSTTEISIEEFGLSDDEGAVSGPSLEHFERDVSLSVEAEEESLGAPTADSDFDALDIDLAFDDTIPAIDTLESVSASAGEPATADDGFETIDLDAFEEPSDQAEIVAEPEPDSLSLDLPLESESPDLASMELGEDLGDDFSAFVDEETSSDVLPSLEIESVTLGEDQPSGFDDVKALEDDLSTGPDRASSDMLGKIALELSSIRDELVSLRSQLSSLKAAGAVSADRDEPVVVPEDDEESAAGGFFDDEDDDTIALTGDELDNILNTADFTEESADNEPVEPVETSELTLPSDLDLLPENGDYQAGIEPIPMPVVETDEEEQAAIATSAEELAPLTPPPEDTSFLDSEDELGELEGMPLDDVPLVEPDPSDLDIIIDSAFGPEDDEIPIIESIQEEPSPILEEIEPEIILDIDADDEPVVSTVDAYPELVPEDEGPMELEELLEPDDLGGLELHAEEALEPIELEDSPAYGPEASLDSIESLEAMADELSITQTDEVLAEPFEASAFEDTLTDDVTLDEPQAEELSLEEPALEELSLEEPALEELSLDEPALEELSLEEPALETPDALEETIAELDIVEEADAAELDEEAGFGDEETFLEPSEEPLSQAEPEPEPQVQAQPAATGQVPPPVAEPESSAAPDRLKHDVKSVLLYLDQLLASLPEEKIEEFASSEYYDTYKRLFDDLGLL